MSIVNLACAEQGIQRVVPWDDESGDVDEELASNVEEYEEEVDSSESQKGVHFGDGSLFLQVVECGVLGKLHVDCTS